METKRCKFIKYLFVLVASLVCISTQANTNDRINKLEDKVLDLEINSLLSKILLSGTFRNSIEHYKTKNNMNGPNRNNSNVLISDLELNFASSLGDRVKFFSTLQASFLYGDKVFIGNAPSYMTDEQIDGDSMRIIKAYADLSILPQLLTFSIGRLPTIKGPPAEYYVMDERLGTYPALAYSVPFDGLALSWDIGNTFGLEDRLTFRTVYALNSKNSRSAPWDGKDSISVTGNSGKIAQEDRFYTMMVDYSGSYKKVVSKMNLIAQYYEGTLGRAAVTRSHGLNNDTVNFYDMYSDDKNLGRVRGLVSHVDFKNILNSKFDFYTTYAKYWYKKLGDISAKIVGTNTINSLGGYLYSEDEQGHRLLLGLRYNINELTSVGGEYIESSKGALPSARFSIKKTDFYSFIGTGYHTYVSRHLYNNKVHILLGHYYSNYSNELNIKYVESDKRISNIYSLLTLKF